MAQGGKEGMPQRMLTVKQHLDSAVQCRKQTADGNALDFYTIQDTTVRHHLHKAEPATKGGIQQSNGAIRCIHSSQQIDIIRDSKGFVRVWQLGLQFFALPQTLGRLNQSNKFAKDFRDIATVDLVNDEYIGALGAFCWGCP